MVDNMAYPLMLQIKLTPKAAADRIGEIRKNTEGQDILQVYVTAPPDKNKANEALIRLLARHFDVAPSRVIIVKGHTSRQKLIEISA